MNAAVALSRDPGMGDAEDWREQLRRLPEPVRLQKRVVALAFALHCLDHKLERHAEDAAILKSRRARLLQEWAQLTDGQLELFEEGL